MVESMVAITVLIVGLFGIMNLVSRSLSLNRVVSDQTVAANLAMEGIELVKNKIDSNVIQVRPWNFGINEGEYEMDFTSDELLPNENRAFNYDSVSGQYTYGVGSPTRFIRILTIEQPALDEMRVSSFVKWTTRGGGEFSVNLEDRFYNWR